MKKNKNEIKKEAMFDFVSKNRDEMVPCKDCRKRDSCFISPKQNRCTGHETGTPWSIKLEEMTVNVHKDGGLNL